VFSGARRDRNLTVKRLASRAIGVSIASAVKLPIKTLPGGAPSASIVRSQYPKDAQSKTGMASVPIVIANVSLFVAMRMTAVIVAATRDTPATMLAKMSRPKII